MEITQSSSFNPEIASQKLKNLLIADSAGQVHEEALQHALVASLLSERNDGASSAYQSAFGAAMAVGVPTEDAVKFALTKIVQAGLISTKDAENINGVSFRAAQLDNNLEALYDNRGSANDPTIAVMELNSAVEKAKSTLAQINSGELSLTARSLNASSNQKLSLAYATNVGSTSGDNGFLWKPISESDGKLVVLLPASQTGSVSYAELYSSLPPSEETLLEKGRFSGDTHNGGRAHFRFSKPGGAYPDGAYVVATLFDGSQVSFQINDSSGRNGG
jgi:hypothetical protein